METGGSDKAREELVRYVAKRTAANASEQEIVDDLVRRGADRYQAQEFVRHVTTNELQAMNKAGKRAAPLDIILGSILLIGGLALTIGTWMSAAKGGGIVFVWYGAVIAGVGLVGRGIWKMRW